MEDFEEDIMGELSTVGDEFDDEGGDDVIGALVKRALMARGGKRRGRGRGMVRPVARQQAPKWANHLTGQGVSRASEELDSLPMSTQLLTAAAPAGFAEAFPQRPFRGERLIATAILLDSSTPGVFQDANNLVVISPAIFVGAVQVGASQGSTPLAAFGPTAFGVRLSMPAAGQGTRVFIPYQSIAGLTVTQSIAVSITIIGRAVR